MLKDINYNSNNRRINFVFALAFSIILLVSGSLSGLYTAKASSAQTVQYSHSPFSSSSIYSPATSPANAGLGYSPSTAPSVPISSSSPSSSSSTSNSSSLIQITAGRIQDLGFVINNIAHVTLVPTPVTNLAVSLVSQSSSVRILGPSNWNLPTISSGSGQQLTTQVFASTSLIGSPVFFTVTVQYIQFGHQVRTSSFDLGAIVTGDIQLRVNNLGIRYIGNTPNLVGNILNEGNTPAQFASVEMLKQGQMPLSAPLGSNTNLTIILMPNSSEYVGNIATNSPVPFNIPLQTVQLPTSGQHQQNTTTINKNPKESVPVPLTTATYNTAPGTYPVSLKITYRDDLKNTHQIVVNSTVSLLGVQSLTQITSTNGFVDVYWAANTARIASGNNTLSTTVLPSQQEVGPGEGQSILAVVLSNTAFSNINGIIGYLTLPSGFSAVTGGGTSSNNVHQITANSPVTAIASLNSLVQSGQTYTLYFKVKIENSATVGTHNAPLRIYYFKVPELQPGQYSAQTFTIPFMLQGKVILDAVPKITSLNPGVSNEAKIQLVNRGSAEAHSVIVSVTGITGNSITGSNVANNAGGSSNNSSTGGQITTTSPQSSIPTVNLGARTFDIGSIPVNGTAEVDPIIYPSDSAGGTLQNLNLQVSYSDANGNAKSSNLSVGFLVLPTPPEAGLSVSPSNGPSPSISNSSNSLSSSSNTTNPNDVSGNNNRNNNTNSTAGIAVSPSYTTSGVTSKPINDNNSFSNNTPIVPAIYNIPIGNNTHTATVATTGTTIHSSGTVHSHISAAVTSSTSTNTTAGNNVANNNLNSTALTVVAGNVADMRFNIANNNNFPVTHAVVSIASQSSDLKIVGDSLWSLPILGPNSRHEFSTKVYASASLIGSPVSFLVTLQYISGGQSKMGSFILGGHVVGDIKISVTDLAINYVAGVPNLVGNLLNQGNTLGLFTTVQMTSQPFSSSSSTAASGGNGQPVNQQHHRHNGQGAGGGSGAGGTQTSSTTGPSSFSTNSSTSTSSALPPPQYLGDLQPDSPLPFSIPIGVDLNNTAPGTYPVSLKITYSDDLKNSHEIVVNSPVLLKTQQPRGSSNHGGGLFGFLGIGGGSQGRGGLGGSNSDFFGIPFPLLLAIIAAIAIGAILFRRRRRSKGANVISSESALDNTDDSDDEDIESLIDGSGDSKKKGKSSETPVH
jgi:hypothetical protein